MYNFKRITVVPTAKDFINIMLSKTQRKTPTVVHKHYKISRIRQFYMRKVRYTQQNFHDRLTMILTEFPKLDEIHPFYADLLNILYDKDHYKVALGQINIARNLIDNAAKDYVRLLKYGDSLYRCKQLKRAALGRMVKIMKRQASALEYLEHVRQHLSRLPSIDPNTRTILICGFPNVGKSSFMNKITRADVDVQPYAFTTKSLYVGHMDYKYLRWQVIDTPGLLDHSLEERNIIEMQAITALAHLKAAVLYVFDLSSHCGQTLGEQVSLFESIKPLFQNKPLLVAANKCDITKLEDLSEEDRKLLAPILDDDEIPFLEMSAETGVGVMEVKQEACERLLNQRVETKIKSKKVSGILNRLRVAMPKPRDDKERAPFIPEAVFRKKAMMEQDEEQIQKVRKLEKDLERELGDDYILDLKKHYDLPDDVKYDVLPEFWNGHNIADFIDPEIEKKLQSLEAEEEARIKAGMYDEELSSDDEEGKEIAALAQKIRDKKKVMKIESNLKKSSTKPVLPRTARKRERSVSRLRSEMSELGMEETENIRGRSKSKPTSAKRQRLSASVEGRSRSRSASRVTPRDQSGVRDAKMANKVQKIGRKAQKPFNRLARKGEGDRTILTMKPKHLYSGKRKMGKTDRRELLESIKENIFTIANAVGTLDRSFSQVGTERDCPGLRDDIHMVQQKTNQMIQVTTHHLGLLAKESTEKRQKLLVQRLRANFEIVLKSYSKLQKSVSAGLRRHLVPPHRKLTSDSELVDVEAHGTSESPAEREQKQQLQYAIQQEEFQRELLLEKETRIRQIESDVMDVSVIMKQLAGMVQEQGEVVDRIEDNVEVTFGNVQEGTDQIRQAASYQNKFRRRLCLFLLFLILLGIVIGVVVYMTSSKEPESS
ncbi:unnamed protein product [Cyprideis torosa]|uniref:Uncharacterized protein n=1 Tax=Cyprideis torosa TaxID=163714 RepID=A0A7R8ZP40_9CRUS|nr:unnamed protein product [Cyprideis torosa]CAG0887719.1 unnamed protein product [Cyprideis torosa]